MNCLPSTAQGVEPTSPDTLRAGTQKVAKPGRPILMKKVIRVEPAQFANIRRQVMEDESRGIDPGTRWAVIYPGFRELEFVVVWPTMSQGV